MNDALLIQQCYSGSQHFARMMALHYAEHTEYCLRWKIDYWAIQADSTKINWQLGCWSKIELVIRALSLGYKKVIWLDADAHIADMGADIRDGCPGGIGACIHDANGVPRHLNVGVMYFDNTPDVVRFMARWLELAPGCDNWNEQGIFNNLATHRDYIGIVFEIGDRWNSTVNTNEVENPAVIGWHGVGNPETRLALMTEYAKTRRIV